MRLPGQLPFWRPVKLRSHKPDQHGHGQWPASGDWQLLKRAKVWRAAKVSWLRSATLRQDAVRGGPEAPPYPRPMRAPRDLSRCVPSSARPARSGLPGYGGASRPMPLRFGDISVARLAQPRHSATSAPLTTDTSSPLIQPRCALHDSSDFHGRACKCRNFSSAEASRTTLGFG